MDDLETSIGVTVYLPNCSFQAELSRAAVRDSISAIDAALTSTGFTADDTKSRIAAVMSRSVGVSAMMAEGEISQEDGVSEIAYGFLYAYSKKQGMEGLSSLRGLAGCLADSTLYLNACPDVASYQRAVADMREAATAMLGFDEDRMVERTPAKPTIH